MKTRKISTVLAGLSILALAACGGNAARTFGGSEPPQLDASHPESIRSDRTTIWDIFRNKDTETNVKVNKYIWNASLEILNFLPVQSVDPFTGVIVTGYGTPPGGGQPYRATVYISDPALDARSLNVAMQTRGGPVSAATQRAVEDAILARARQLRGSDSRF